MIPTPVAPTTYPSEAVDNIEIQTLLSSVPSSPYLQGLPIQYQNITYSIYGSPLVLYTSFTIYFDKTPFTYLNFSNTTNEDCPQLELNIYNVPLGALFFVNGPSKWKLQPGFIFLKDLDSDRNFYSNSIIEIPDRTVYESVMIVRNRNGFVGVGLTS